jgi:hypothetical protein
MVDRLPAPQLKENEPSRENELAMFHSGANLQQQQGFPGLQLRFRILSEPATH